MLAQRLGRLTNWCSEAYRLLVFQDIHTWGLRLFFVGFLLMVLGWFWLIARAFRLRFWWGLAALFPPTMILLVALKFRKVVWPVGCMFVGLASCVGAHFVEEYNVAQYLGPRERMVDGQYHLTLTGWNQKDYLLLVTKPHAKLVHLANPDVTDETLEYLLPMSELSDLDLSDTLVTDAGLLLINEFPVLEKLKLARTKITDAGFRRSLFAKESLRMLDLRGTPISKETGKLWRDAKPGRKLLQ